MGRFIWSQLLHRRTRAATLGLGILVAAVSFTLLTSATNTSALRIRGTIRHNFRSAYDILVRPPGSYAPLERSEGLVRDNYLSGIFGGITLRQWHEVLAVPGVQLAAPIEMIGYILPFQRVVVPLNRYLTHQPFQLFRIRVEKVANGGVSRYPEPDVYVYYTRAHRFVLVDGAPAEQIPGRTSPAQVCNAYNSARPLEPSSPFDRLSGSYIQCFSARSPELAGQNFSPPPQGIIGTTTDAYFPILLAAIDPVQEDLLVRLDRTIVRGRALREGEGAVLFPPTPHNDVGVRNAPVIASTKTFVGETFRAVVEHLRVPSGVDVPAALGSGGARRFLRRLSGTVVGTQASPMQAVYERFLAASGRGRGVQGFESYRTVSQISYRNVGPDHVAPLPVTNPNSVWVSKLYGTYVPTPIENEDVQFRRLTPHVGDNNIVNDIVNIPGLSIVGRFDPGKLPGFSALSRVPLETYRPPLVQPADAKSRSALHGRALLPTMNLGDDSQQPPLMLTTLQAARLFFNPQYFSRVNERAPISVIRVRVSGVTGPDPLSLARIKQVALTIHQRTGLPVDITAGSSPHPLLISLPAGKFGRPPLLLREGWSKKGVAVRILEALDRKSLSLFVLVLVVTGLFLMNGALASVRTRRSEIGTLLALGWSRGKIFRAVLGELAFVGLIAGLVGTGIAAGLVKLLDFAIPLRRTLLVAPIAMVLAVLAGLLPAWRAARALPLDAVRPRVADRRSGHSVKRIGSMAFSNLWRLPGRTLLAAAGLFVGVGALALLLSITLAFKGTLLGTALGAFISVQVRGVDYLGVVLAVLLAAISVADVLFLNLRERAPEMVTLRATGWHESHLARMVALEGLGIGLLGSVTGAAAGIGLSALVGGSPGRIVLAGVIAALMGTVVALGASLLPASLVSRMTPPSVLAEE